MKLIALGALFLPFVLVYGDLFGVVDPLCAPCLNEVVADGPSNTQSKEFANYLCMGPGASAVGLCISESECGISTSDEIIDQAEAQGRSAIITGIVFDYCVQYYPEETCATVENTEFAQLPPCPEIRKGRGNGGNDSPGSDSEDSTTETTEATETTSSGNSHVTYSAPGSDSTGSSPQSTSSSNSGSSGSGSRGSSSSHTSTGGIPAAMGAFPSWEMLTGLVILAVNT